MHLVSLLPIWVLVLELPRQRSNRKIECDDKTLWSRANDMPCPSWVYCRPHSAHPSRKEAVNEPVPYGPKYSHFHPAGSKQCQLCCDWESSSTSWPVGTPPTQDDCVWLSGGKGYEAALESNEFQEWFVNAVVSIYATGLCLYGILMYGNCWEGYKGCICNARSYCHITHAWLASSTSSPTGINLFLFPYFVISTDHSWSGDADWQWCRLLRQIMITTDAFTPFVISDDNIPSSTEVLSWSSCILNI